MGLTVMNGQYGSGAASTLFGMRATGDLTNMVQKIDFMSRLKQRNIQTPEDYEKVSPKECSCCIGVLTRVH